MRRAEFYAHFRATIFAALPRHYMRTSIGLPRPVRSDQRNALLRSPRFRHPRLQTLKRGEELLTTLLATNDQLVQKGKHLKSSGKTRKRKIVLGRTLLIVLTPMWVQKYLLNTNSGKGHIRNIFRTTRRSRVDGIMPKADVYFRGDRRMAKKPDCAGVCRITVR